MSKKIHHLRGMGLHYRYGCGRDTELRPCSTEREHVTCELCKARFKDEDKVEVMRRSGLTTR